MEQPCRGEYQVEFGEGFATMIIAPEMTAIALVSVGISLFPLPLWAWYNNQLIMLSQEDFEKLINNPKKYINNDIIWKKSAVRSFSLVFETKITSDVSYPLVIKGKYIPLAEKLSYTILYNGVGRIYALDIGQDHKNPDGLKVGDKHKHRWVADINIKDKKAYRPSDITALPSEPKNVWEQFCLEAKIIHNGVMHEPPLLDLEIEL